MSPRFHLRPLSVQPDDRLVELAGGGDERAFEALVKRHRRSLVAYCRRIGLPEHRAEDVLQQALTRAWLALGRGAEVREPRAWLHRIVHNTALNAVRAERRHAHEPIELASGAGGAEIDAGLEVRDALGHVAALPEQQREALLLTAVEGRSHDEAADVMGLTDGAVRGLLYRARTSLRRAAAAFAPLGWLGRSGGGDGGLAGRTAEVSAGGAAAGAAGLIGKGAIATGVAALLAAGGTIAHIESGGRAAHRHRAAIASPRISAAAREPASARIDTSVAATGTHASAPASAVSTPVRGRSPRSSGNGPARFSHGGRRHSEQRSSGGTDRGGTHRRSGSGGHDEGAPEGAAEYTAATLASSGPPVTHSEAVQQPKAESPSEAPAGGERTRRSEDPPGSEDGLGSDDGEGSDDGSTGEAPSPSGEETQTRRDG